jgi:hypothetical protein
MLSFEGRSLIRTFLAGATKDAAVYEMSIEQAQNKKLSSYDFTHRPPYSVAIRFRF